MEPRDYVLTFIGLVGAGIAYLQWRTNHLKVKLDLFERRWAIYAATTAFIGAIERDFKPTDEERIAYLRSTGASKFLLSEKADEFRDELHRLAITFRRLHLRMDKYRNDSSKNDEFLKLVDEDTALIGDLGNMRLRAIEIMGPLLDVSKIG